MSYEAFLARKLERFEPMGFEPGQLPSSLFDFQRAIVEWTVRRGRAAVFAGCGLGKTPMQLAWAEQCVRKTNKPALILTPLAVAPQTIREAEKFGVEAVHIRETKDARVAVCVTNYHKLLAGHIDPAAFSAVVLDESSILKAFMGKTKRLLIEAFGRHEYRLACTATPAPNDYMELGNHSQFLGVMDSDEMLSRWFIADQANCGHYRLKGHARADFWRWAATWAVCIDKPSDLGYPDDGFILPALRVEQHVVEVDIASGAEDGALFRAPDLAATGIHREMRLTASARADRVAELAARPGPWIVWCNTNYEADALVDRIPGAVEVRGEESEDTKEEKLLAFSSGQARVIISKPSICGFGLNWQHCNQVAFVGLSYSYEQFYQAVRRSWRFGQTKPVECHVVRAETEGAVLATIQHKERESERMREEMIAASRAGLLEVEARRLTASERDMEKSERWEMILGDSCEVLREMPANEVDFSIFSPPFLGLYIYSEAAADLGNSADDAEFFQHYGEFLAPELLRVTSPGRLCAVHCKDLPRYAGRDGTAGLKDFPGAIRASMEGAGWSFHSRVTIWKCPVTERERTNNNGLLYKTVRRDSTQLRMGMADYLLVFRKPPTDGLLAEKPLARPDGFTEYHGEIDPRESAAHASKYARSPSSIPGLAVWQRYAEPVWWDIDQTDTLNESIARENNDERHICPLQLGVIRRALQIWSDPGELVLSPFAGIGSEGFVALQEGRRFRGIELKRAYWEKAVRYLKSCSVQPELFSA